MKFFILKKNCQVVKVQNTPVTDFNPIVFKVLRNIKGNVLFLYFITDTKLAFTAERSDSNRLAVKLVSLYCQYPSKPVLYQVFYQEHKKGRQSCQDGNW